MTRASAFALLLLLSAAPAAAQTAPCDQPATQTFVNPSKVYAVLPDQSATAPDGGPVVTDYQLGYFLPGVSPATGTPALPLVTVAKTAWTLVPGSSSCYLLQLPLPPALPLGTVYVSALRAHQADRATAAEVFGDWSTVSNPFGRAAAPRVGLLVLQK